MVVVLLCSNVVLNNESTCRSIWITIEKFLAQSRIWIHRDRVMQLMKQALYLQATTAGFNVLLSSKFKLLIKEHIFLIMWISIVIM